MQLTRDEEIAILTLQKPFSVDSEGKAGLTRIFSELSASDSPRVLILTAREPRAFLVGVAEMAHAMEDAPYPIIAAIEGPALGGVTPGFGGTWRLARRAGYQRAMEMLLTAAIVDAAAALSYGLVLEISPRGEAFNTAKMLAGRIIRTSKASVSAIKRTARLGWNLNAAAADALEEAIFPTLFGPEQSARMHSYLNATKGD